MFKILKTDIKKIISVKILLISLLFGLCSFFLIFFGINFYIPTTEALSDPREIFNSIGAAITGPIGGIIIGIISTLADPPAANKLHTVFQHITYGIWTGLAYKYFVYKRKNLFTFSLAWLFLIFVYYFIAYIPGFFILYKFYYNVYLEFIGYDDGFINVYLRLMKGFIPEYIFTSIYTLIVMLAIPAYYRKPLWGKEISVNYSDVIFNKIKKYFKYFSPISIRLTAWFLVLLILPMLLITFFIRNYYAESLIEKNALYQFEVSKDLSHKFVEMPKFNRRYVDSLVDLQRNSILFLLRPDSLVLISRMKDGEKFWSLVNEKYKAIIESNKNGYFIDMKKSLAFGYSFFKDSHGILIAVSPPEIIQKSINDFSLQIYTYLFFSLIIISVLSAAVIGLIIGAPVKKIEKVALEIANNNLDIEFDKDKLYDELRLLSEALTKMKNSLLQSATEIKKEAKQIIRLEEEKKSFVNLLQQITENIYDVIFQVDDQYIIRYVTPSVKNALGYSTNDLLGKKILDFIDENNYDLIKSKFEEVKNLNKPANCELKLKDASGKELNFDIYLNSYINESGERNIVCSAREITERKMMENEIEEKNKFINSILENLPLSVLAFNLEGKTIYKNKKFDEIAGWDPSRYSSLNELNSLMFRDKEVIDLLVNRVIKLYESNEPLAEIKPVKSYTQSGEYRFLSIKHFKEKNSNYMVVLTEDITKQVFLEKELKFNEEKFRSLFEQSLAGMCMTDERGKIIEWNKSMSELLGIEKEFAIGANVIDLFSKILPEDSNLHTLFLREIETVLLKGETSSQDSVFEFSLMNKNSGIKYIKMNIFPIQSENTLCLVLLVNDITRLKENELLVKIYIKELEDKNKELERFTYTVSHDLRSPILTIKGFIGMILNDIKANKYDRILQDANRINYAAEKMQNLLNDLLELSRIGRIVNPSSEFSLTEVAKEAKELLASLIDDKISIEIEENLPIVFADKVRIRQVFQNLIENAIKYRNKNINTKIKIGSFTEGNKKIIFVRDNGIGIKEEFFEKIFGLFQKLDSSTEGTGIGLALVKRIVELHGGKIWVASEGENKGSTFYFTLSNLM